MTQISVTQNCEMLDEEFDEEPAWTVSRRGPDGLWHILWICRTEAAAREKLFEKMTSSMPWENLHALSAVGQLILPDDVLKNPHSDATDAK